jgi:hypothetical protein
LQLSGILQRDKNNEDQRSELDDEGHPFRGCPALC